MGAGTGRVTARRWRRGLVSASLVLVVLAGLLLVLVSPLALQLLDEGDDQDWQRLSNIGETYGAVSAVLSGLALAGVVVSLGLQRRAATLDRLEAHRTLQLALMQMALDNRDYMACWGTPRTQVRSELEVRQHSYCNQVVSLWEMSFEVGGTTEEWIRISARELFGSEISRRWWSNRLGRPAETRRKRRLHQILDEQLAEAEAAAPTRLQPPAPTHPYL